MNLKSNIKNCIKAKANAKAKTDKQKEIVEMDKVSNSRALKEDSQSQ